MSGYDIATFDNVFKEKFAEYRTKLIDLIAKNQLVVRQDVGLRTLEAIHLANQLLLSGKSFGHVHIELD